MNLETFKKVLSLTPNQTFMHVGHPNGSGVLYTIKETFDNVLLVDAAQLSNEVDILEIIKPNKGKSLTVVVVDANRMLPSIHNSFMREFFFNFPTNFDFQNSRLILLTNYEYKTGDDPAYEVREMPFMDMCICDKFTHYYIEKEKPIFTHFGE